MSSKLQASGEDYPEAALKHCDDAGRLLSGRRADGAAYLAGYAVECALKTLVQVEERARGS
jgi:HEPN domain-containing protein